MTKLGVFECNTITFDIFNTERVPRDEKTSDYYLTPNGLKNIEKWRISQKLTSKIQTEEEIQYIIKQGWLRKY